MPRRGAVDIPHNNHMSTIQFDGSWLCDHGSNAFDTLGQAVGQVGWYSR